MSWQEIKKTNLTNIDILCEFLELSIENRKKIITDSKFPLNLPLRLAKKIEKNRLDDPLFRQFVPLKDEEEQKEGFHVDPVAECEFKQGPNLLQKYAGRALLLCTKACAMHCRYCFRRHAVFQGDDLQFQKELQVIAEETSLTEVVLSGGDPLSLSNRKLRSRR